MNQVDGLLVRALPGRVLRLGVFVCLGAFVALCAHGLLVDTPTVDEFAHLPAGYFYLRTANFSLFPQNPPLVKMVAALPLLALAPDFERRGSVIQNTGWYPWAYGADFMARNRAAYALIFLLGRSMIVLLGVALGILVFVWARALYGDGGGLLALFLFAFCPSLIAHAHLATVDVGHAAGMVLALFCFGRYLEAPGRGRLLLAGLTLGLAELTKFTALLLYPIFVLLAVVALARGSDFPLWELRSRGGRLAGSLASLAIIFLLSVVVIDAGYLGRGVGRPLGMLHLSSRLLAGLAALPSSTPSPLPLAYLAGLDNVQYINDVGEFPSYLFGSWSSTGWVTYYLVALLFKSPLPFLGLLVVAGSCRRLTEGREALVWVPLVVLLGAFSLLSRVEYGIRYVLPVLPLACIWAGRLARDFAAQPRFVRTAAAILLAIYPLSVLGATPDTLAYFNVLAGGRGDRILLDSNFDWGQGLERLRRAMERRGLASIPLAYFGHVDPALYGVRATPLVPGSSTGYVAVSANLVHGAGYAAWVGDAYVEVPENAYRSFASLPVEEDLGGIFLYRLSAPGAPSGAD